MQRSWVCFQPRFEILLSGLRGERRKILHDPSDLEFQCDEIYNVIRAHPRWAPCGEYRLAADEPLIEPVIFGGLT